ncbi:Fic family protein [Cellulomonas bogoriensis]|uniref:Cell filamentation protein Fic n=1 Tax=Cellulomonas bogoriensis 69B4 = DSM 16987 TaxID=1386082 RepID=A0A0A0C1D2_9CELL|nr:Fic family protein [Cellulomonas bogoriensis]KGM13184.1 cell filamentation protein Fic [Cellulomonas bogoriensis 69B4 = DSM 16987]
MQSFTDLDQLIGAVPFAIVTDLRTVDIGRGSEALYRDKLPALLTSLADRARVASIEASSAIEGVVVEDRARAAEILAGRATTLHTRSEQELAGYRAALDYLYQEAWRPLNTGLILHLHRLLFGYTQMPGGTFKQVDNVVVDRLPDGTKVKRFTPVSAQQTPSYVDELVTRYVSTAAANRHHPVLLVGLFALDLLTIHPFPDGNGRITRALTNALLQDAGYDVTRYVSLETSVARSADAYYAALLDSTHGWHDAAHDPWPWLRYFTRTVADSYEQFATLTATARVGGSKQDRVRTYVLEHAPVTFRIADIRAALPGVSDPTIRLALNQMKAEGSVEADGAGRGATWTRHARSG